MSLNEIAVEYDASADRHFVDVPLDGSSDVGRAVVVGVAEILDQDPVSLPPLGKTVDTESLTALIDSTAESDCDASVSFDYAGFTVTVHSSGRLTFEETY